MMSDEMRRAFDAADEDSIPFVSKLKVKRWVNCQQKFYQKTILDSDTDDGDSDAITTGLAVHDAIEDFYHNAESYVEEHGDVPDRIAELLPEDRSEWEHVLDPYVTNFLSFELRRLSVSPSVSDWLPVGIEEEAWNWNANPPWMGRADALYTAASLKPVATTEGVTLVDFKTGSIPHPDFRDTGIYLELEYYSMLFDDEYDIQSIGAYYPLEDKLITDERSEERQQFIQDAIAGLTSADYDDPSEFEPNEQPLCCWGSGEGERCPFYEDCDSTWAKPVDNQREFRDACRSCTDVSEVAEEMGVSEDSVEYWVRKLNR